jgi:hypothetical protein
MQFRTILALALALGTSAAPLGKIFILSFYEFLI